MMQERETEIEFSRRYSPRSAARPFMASTQKAMCSSRSTPSSCAPLRMSSRLTLRANAFNYGGGLNWWIGERVGLKFEIRDQYGDSVHYWGMRFGVTFR